VGVPLSFQIADSVVFGDLDRFLRWFSASVGRRLKLANRLGDYWDEVFGSKDNCTAYFEEYILPNLTQPLVLCLDEVDMVFQHESIAADFFGLLRNWHETVSHCARGCEFGGFVAGCADGIGFVCGSFAAASVEFGAASESGGCCAAIG
jgi:hypothetical protein